MCVFAVCKGGMAGAVQRGALNKDRLDLKSRCVSSANPGANLIGGRMGQDKTQSTFVGFKSGHLLKIHITVLV